MSAPDEQQERNRRGAIIEREWPGHHAVLSRRYCKAYPLKGYDHCRYHLSLDERDRKRALPVPGGSAAEQAEP